jgi:hypothetical protein
MVLVLMNSVKDIPTCISNICQVEIAYKLNVRKHVTTDMERLIAQDTKFNNITLRDTNHTQS